MRTMALLLCAVACAKARPPELGPDHPLVLDVDLQRLRDMSEGVLFNQQAVTPSRTPRVASETHVVAPGVEVKCSSDPEGRLVSVAVDPREAERVPREHVLGCPGILPDVPIVVRFVEAP